MYLFVRKKETSFKHFLVRISNLTNSIYYICTSFWALYSPVHKFILGQGRYKLESWSLDAHERNQIRRTIFTRNRARVLSLLRSRSISLLALLLLLLLLQEKKRENQIITTLSSSSSTPLFVMALQFLESQRELHPELAEWYTALADLYQQKLWHQLTLKLEQFVTLAVVQVRILFSDIYGLQEIKFQASSFLCFGAGFYVKIWVCVTTFEPLCYLLGELKG